MNFFLPVTMCSLDLLERNELGEFLTESVLSPVFAQSDWIFGTWNNMKIQWKYIFFRNEFYEDIRNRVPKPKKKHYSWLLLESFILLETIRWNFWEFNLYLSKIFSHLLMNRWSIKRIKYPSKALFINRCKFCNFHKAYI